MKVIRMGMLLKSKSHQKALHFLNLFVIFIFLCSIETWPLENLLQTSPIFELANFFTNLELKGASSHYQFIINILSILINSHYICGQQHYPNSATFMSCSLFNIYKFNVLIETYPGIEI
ncbi:hypothetical protein AAZX31_13G044500 [Glycine max]